MKIVDENCERIERGNIIKPEEMTAQESTMLGHRFDFRVKKIENEAEKLRGELKKAATFMQAIVKSLGVNIKLDGERIGYGVPLDPQNQGILAQIFREIADIRESLDGKPRIIRPH